MKIAVIIGTRPEIIKMSSIIRYLEENRSNYFVLHTGQHYSYNLDKVFFEQLHLPQATVNLEVGSGTHAEQTAKIMVGVEKVLIEEQPDAILVEGDTNSVLGGALAAAKLHIKVGHVEAGLRSYDSSMPEEINRILTDHCSDYCFAPTENARKILLSEGIAKDKIFVTGNSVVDAVYQNLKIAETNNNILNTLGISSNEFLLLTLHRQENIDNASRFTAILAGVKELQKELKIPVIYPIHPHSRKRMGEFGIDSGNIKVIEPVDYLSFLRLEKSARLILTDSGGVQEEGCILKTPCITLRDNTERPETIEVGSNMLAGTTPEKILEYAHIMLDKKHSWENPFGDGKTGERIVNILMKHI